MDKLIKRDVIRLADAIESIDLWQQEQAKPGSVFPNSDYEPAERIKFYEAKKDKYRAHVIRHIGVSPSLVDIVIGILTPLFKGTVIEQILKILF